MERDISCYIQETHTVEEFEQNLEQNLSEIQRQLKENHYVPNPVKRVLIPKDNGKMRQLGVPTVKDRVVQQALKNVLEPIFEKIFYHKILMDLVCEQVSDGRVLSWIESILKSGIMNEGVFEESTEGTPQGGNISPLLANIYLNHFDRRMGEYGYLLLRYADDIIIFCKHEWEAEDALKRAKEILERELKLELSHEKTKIVHGNVTGVEFLGFHFNGRWKKPKDKAVEKFKSEIKKRTRRKIPISLETVIGSLNVELPENLCLDS
ncbi:hypothetical protein KJ656_11915 [bacterium]|nr:hypothetical protein [bacterium]